MIEETVIVVGVEGDQLLLEARNRSACGGCAAAQGCGTASLSRVLGRKVARFRVKNTVAASTGDTLVVGLSGKALLRGALLVYLLPLLAMMLSAVLADALLVDGVSGKEALVIVAGLAGLAVSLAWLRRYFSRQTVRHRHRPVILRKVLPG